MLVKIQIIQYQRLFRTIPFCKSLQSFSIIFMTKKFCTDAAGISLGLLKNEKVFQYPHCIVIENHIFQTSFFASMRLFWFLNCDNFPSFVVIIRFCLPSASNGIDLQCTYDTHHGKLQHCSKRIHCVFVYLPVSVVVAAHCHQYNTVHTVPTTDKRDHELVVESVWSICLICNCTLPWVILCVLLLGYTTKIQIKAQA